MTLVRPRVYCIHLVFRYLPTSNIRIAVQELDRDQERLRLKTVPGIDVLAARHIP